MALYMFDGRSLLRPYGLMREMGRGNPAATMARFFWSGDGFEFSSQTVPYLLTL